MIIKTGAFREHGLAWACFLGVFAALYAVTLYLGRFVDAAWDIRLLLFLNPDAYIPLLEQLVILQTDWAAYCLAIFAIAWQVGYYSSRGSALAQQRTQSVFIGVGVLYGVWHGLGFVFQNRGVFWWGEYEHSVIFLPLGVIFFAGFVFLGNLFVRLTDEDQRKLAHAVWLMIIAVVFVNFFGEDTIKATVQRHRPLHGTYEAWNHQLRVIPDEVVRGSYSYISGHTSSFWAQTVVFFWLVRSWKFRALILSAGLFHGYTRIYTAVHFPYCVLMATVFGFAVTTAIYFFLWNHRGMPLLAMLLLCAGLLEVAGSATIPSVLALITLVWYAVYRIRTRNAPQGYAPILPALEWPRT